MKEFVLKAIVSEAIQIPMNKADFEGDGAILKWVPDETPTGRWAQPSFNSLPKSNEKYNK